MTFTRGVVSVSRNMVSLISLSLCLFVHYTKTQLSCAFVVKNSRITDRRKFNAAVGTAVERSPRSSFPFLLGVTADVSVMKSEIEEDTIVHAVLGALEKRLTHGGLSDAETSSAIMASDFLLGRLHLDEEEEEDYDEKLEEMASSSIPKITVNEAWNADTFRTAILSMDADLVSEMIKAGFSFDEDITESAFWSVVKAIDHAEAENEALSANVTNMLHHIFDADQQLLRNREKLTTNLTCMQPDDGTGTEGSARAMNYVFDDSSHKDLPLMEGRRCEDGHCCDKCSRNVFPTFATDKESTLETYPGIESISFNDLHKVPASAIVQFVRLIERVRRTISHEYGVPLKTILPLQAYSRKYVAGSTQMGGGGGEGDFVTLHTDEATHQGYHYSCVLYLSTQGVDFEGGNFVFNDPQEIQENDKIVEEEDDDDYDDGALLEAFFSGELPDLEFEDGHDNDSSDNEPDEYISLEEEIRRTGRTLKPYHPTRGAAVIFSSGWENMHEVEKITSGTRYAVPCFFTTSPVPEVAYDQMKVGKPKTDEDIADDWLHLLLAHRQEKPIESVGRVKELLMKWHNLCTPLSEH